MFWKTDSRTKGMLLALKYYHRQTTIIQAKAEAFEMDEYDNESIESIKLKQKHLKKKKKRTPNL